MMFLGLAIGAALSAVWWNVQDYSEAGMRAFMTFTVVAAALAIIVSKALWKRADKRFSRVLFGAAAALLAAAVLRQLAYWTIR